MEALEKLRDDTNNIVKTVFADVAVAVKDELESRERNFAQEKQRLLDNIEVLEAQAITLKQDNEKLRNEPKTIIKSHKGSTVAETATRLEFERRDREFAKEKQVLLDNVEVLEAQALKLKQENQEYRKEHETINNPLQGIAPLPIQTSITSGGSTALNVRNGGSTFVPNPYGHVVDYEEYSRVSRKCEEALRQVDLIKRKGGVYKNAYETYKKKYETCKKKFEHGKASIKVWQEYSDGLSRASKSPARDAAMGAAMTTDKTPLRARTFASRGSSVATPASLMSPLVFTDCPSSRGTATLPVPSPYKQASPTILEKPSSLVNVSNNNAMHDAFEVCKKVGAKGYDDVRPIENTGTISICANCQINESTIEEPTDVDLGRFKIPVDGLFRERSQDPNRQLDSPTKQASNIPGFKATKELPSSQTTEGEEQEVFIKQEPATDQQHKGDGDEPTIVSVKSLKRKRNATHRALPSSAMVEPTYRSNGSSKKPFIIKHEDSHSSPIGLAAISNLYHENSLDLDEVPGDVETPRKRRLRRMLSNSSHYRSLDESRYMRATSMPLEAETIAQRLSDSFEAEITEYSSAMHGSSVKTQHAGTRLSSVSLALVEPQEPLVHVMSRENETEHFHYEKNVLQPLSVNRCVTSCASDSRSRLSSKVHQRPAPIHDITEDGEKFNLKHSKHSRATKHGAIGDSKVSELTNTRLKSLLEYSSPSRQLLSFRGSTDKVNQTPKTKSLLLPEDHTPSTTTATPQIYAATLRMSAKLVRTPLHKNNPVMQYEARTGKRSAQPEHGINQIDPEEEPLRARPVERLGLEDFKINPQFNQGLNFAFTEVVRKQEKRRCLPGCMRPECCGDRFRRIVELGGALPAPARGLWDSSPQEHAEQDDDQRLLEAYLGDDRDRLKDMDYRERAEMLITAKAEQLAQKHGKHRQAFQRSATPPGFWRTDMPTTQETEEDRERLRQLERRKVEERYLEAKRANGRWLFRDE